MALGELRGERDAADDRAVVDAALAAFGLVADGPAVSVETFHLWPEHLHALNLFNAVQTQWKVGPMGATGLDYPGVRASPAFNRLAAGDREQVFEDVCVMEYAFLSALSERRAAR